MPEKLKNLFFTDQSLNDLAEAISEYYLPFDKNNFLRFVKGNNWDALELKAKMHHVTHSLHQGLPEDYVSALIILVKAAPKIKGFEGMVLPDYVEQYGMNHWEESLNALGHFTRYASSEFAIRPFLDQKPDLVMQYMMQWAESSHENVRRFASEGCRPRLPWAMVLPQFIVDPSPVLKVLEKLKNDPSEFVRKSVANNLNDISKDNPAIALYTATGWYGYSERTNWIVKHGMRTLLKKGEPGALALLGVSGSKDFEIQNLRLEKDALKIGESTHFGFDLINKGREGKKARLEYIICYAKAKGKSSEKVYQIAEKEIDPGKTTYRRKLAFADLTTRKHYPGRHTLYIVVNGERKAEKEFLLT